MASAAESFQKELDTRRPVRLGKLAEQLAGTTKKLATVAGGAPHGASWKEGLKKKPTAKDMMARVDALLDPKLFSVRAAEAACAASQKVDDAINEWVDELGAVCPTELKKAQDDADTLRKQSWLTRVEGFLAFQFYKTESKSGTLRQACASQKAVLAKHGVPEAEMHAELKKRFGSAVSFRFFHHQSSHARLLFSSTAWVKTTRVMITAETFSRGGARSGLQRTELRGWVSLCVWYCACVGSLLFDMCKLLAVPTQSLAWGLVRHR